MKTVNKEGQVPALRDGDVYIADSTEIIKYLDATYPEVKLIPAEKRRRGTGDL